MSTEPDPYLLDLMGAIRRATTSLREANTHYADISHEWRSASDAVNAATADYEQAKKDLDTYVAGLT